MHFVNSGAGGILQPFRVESDYSQSQYLATTMSSFGKLFRVTTYVSSPHAWAAQLTETHAPSYGESHCRSVGCIVEGVPPGLRLSEEDIQPQLTRRRPGQSTLATPRDEKDRVQIQSGTEYGLTLGTPIGLVVMNESHRPEDYGKGTMDLYAFASNLLSF